MSQSSTSSPANNSSALIGGVVGGVLGCLLIVAILIIVLLMRRKKNNERKDNVIQLQPMNTEYSTIPKVQEYSSVRTDSTDYRSIPQHKPCNDIFSYLFFFLTFFLDELATQSTAGFILFSDLEFSNPRTEIGHG